MNNDSPDTFPEEEQTRWQETVAEDVFLPTVRVQLRWRDVEEAVTQGAIVPQQAHALWANWAMPGSTTRLSSDGVPGGAPFAAQEMPSAPESKWEERPMPAIERRKGGSTLLGFVVGAAVALLAAWGYSMFLAV